MNAPERTAACFDDDVIDAAMPWEGGMLVMLRSFVDASTQGGVMAIAATAFGADNAKNAERELRALFGGRYLHMTDLHNEKGEFLNLAPGESDRLCRGAVQIITRYASHLVVVSCDIAQVETLGLTNADPDSEHLLDGFRHAYPCCMHWLMGAVGNTVGPQSQRIAYWIEKGDLFQGQSRAFLASISAAKYEPLKHYYQIGVEVFAEKKDAFLFGAADLLGWEWARHVERTRNNQLSRKSLVALMEDDQCVIKGRPFKKSSTRFAAHYNGEQVERFLCRFPTQLSKHRSETGSRSARKH